MFRNCCDLKRHPTWNCPIVRFFQLVSVIVTVCLLCPLVTHLKEGVYRIVVITIPIVFLVVVFVDLTLSICFYKTSLKFLNFIALIACLSYLAATGISIFAATSFPYIVIVAIAFLFITAILFLYEVVRSLSLCLVEIAKGSNKSSKCEHCNESKLEKPKEDKPQTKTTFPEDSRTTIEETIDQSTIKCFCVIETQPSKEPKAPSTPKLTPKNDPSQTMERTIIKCLCESRKYNKK